MGHHHPSSLAVAAAVAAVAAVAYIAAWRTVGEPPVKPSDAVCGVVVVGVIMAMARGVS
jgi:hypothetical protein